MTRRRFLLPLAAALPLSATIVPRLSLEEVIAASELIVHGRVRQSHAAWDPARRHIWTHYEIEVGESLKGPVGGRVIVSVPGGVVGNMGMEVSGAGRYLPGEEVVVFLRRTPAGYLRTTGWGQGKYTVGAAPGGPKQVRADLAGVVLADPRPEGKSAPGRAARSGTPDGLPLEEFKALVRRLAGGAPR